VRAVTSIWSRAKSGLANIGRNAIPALKSGLRLSRCKDCGTRPAPAPRMAGNPKDYNTFGEWLKSFPPYAGTGDVNVTGVAPEELRNYVTGAIGAIPDCADVSLLLRHIYLKAHNQTFTFKAGPGEGREFKIGAGVSYEQVKQCELNLGTITFQEDRAGFRLVEFYKAHGTKLTNLKALLNKGLKSGDLFVWKRSVEATGFEGHVQTVQTIDLGGATITFLQGNMEHGVPKGELQQRQRTFQQLTGKADGDADISPTSEETFFGAGPWKG
jgi:hypothetical protein